MSIIRSKHNRENPYVHLNKKPLFDEKLSLKAKGLWAQCLARPDDWVFHVKEMAKHCKEGQKAIYSAIEELIEVGYVYKMEGYLKREDGRFKNYVCEYVFFEFIPTDEELKEEEEKFKKCYQRCHFGNARHGNARNGIHTKEREELIKDSTLPPLSSIPDKLKDPSPPTKEEEEELEKRFKSRSKEAAPIVSKTRWRAKVLKEMREEHAAIFADASTAEKHRRKALEHDMQKWRGDTVYPCQDYVEFVDGSYCKQVRYDVPHEQWVRETGWD